MKIISALLCCLTLNALFAKTITVPIKEVTVYRSEAKITHQHTINITTTDNEIVFDQIPLNIDQNSIEVKATGDITLLSVQYLVNHLKDIETTKRVQRLKDSLDIAQDDLKWLNEQLLILNGEEKVIEQNTKLGGEEKRFTIQELKDLTLFYRTRLSQIKSEKLKLESTKKDKSNLITRLQQQLNNLNYKNNRQTGQIKVQISAKTTTKSTFTFSYITYDANWQPSYELRVEDVDKDIHLTSRAKIYQNTGQDWNNILLTVSTGAPSQNRQKPELENLYLRYYQPEIARKKTDKLYKSEVVLNAPMAAEELDLAFGYEDDFKLEKSASWGDVSVTEKTVNREYLVGKNMTIQSANDAYAFPIEEQQLKAIYEYYVVPKRDKAGYLVANIPDWYQYNLLSAQANVFFQGNYIGETYIDASSPKDTLLLSLGRDEQLSVLRTELKDFTSKRFIGTNKRDAYAYEITLKNNKKIALNITVQDHVPISTNKEIEVSLEELSKPSKHNKDTGQLEWKLALEPGASHKIKLSYSIKYPKDKIISGHY